MRNLTGIIVLLLFSTISVLSQPTKPRTIVTTDGELDDVDSFIRLLLHANEFKIEGLVISSSMWHYKGDDKGTKFVSEMEMTKQLYGERTELRWPGTDWIYNLIDAYSKVYPNLKLHSPGFPTAEYLRSVTRIGNIDFEGEMEKDTEGSDFIKEKLMDNSTEPLYLQVWGGTNTIARALKSIEDQYKNTAQWPSIYKKVCDKAIIYAILDQDATYRKYVSKNWPDVTIYYNANQFWCFAYFWKRAAPKELHHYLEGAFMGPIINNSGPLLKMYYSYGDGNPPAGELEDIYSDPEKIKKNQWGSFTQYDFISEGDSPAFFHLIDVGLENLSNPHFGGWGGRLVQSSTAPNRWEDGDQVTDYNPFTQTLDKSFPQTRWIDVLQNEFAARAAWCVQPFSKANHPPLVKLKTAKVIEAKPGAKVSLAVEVSDPDKGNKIAYTWWQYHEVDSYIGKIKLDNERKSSLTFTIPSDAKEGDDIHIVFSASDSGTPSLTRYARTVLKIK
ncbi:MAG: DUF1593 domain-containing protein [Cytophagales bacterium]|jgi:hypothetical protein|nr:DUF1593 domain-containing protein [Cytophagales bacterium]